jgi:hypothetical protein
MSDLVTIYALTDPDSGEVRYVGQTKDVWKRYSGHLLMAKGSASKHGWFKDLQQRQRGPLLKILEEHIETHEAKAREEWWIKYYRGDGADLVNAKATRGPRGTLSDLLCQHGIQTIADFSHRTGLSKQYGWLLWHGKVNIGLRMAKRLSESLNLPYTVFLDLQRPVPPSTRPPGRPRQRKKDTPEEG